jgi:hypothetical protein
MMGEERDKDAGLNKWPEGTSIQQSPITDSSASDTARSRQSSIDSQHHRNASTGPEPPSTGQQPPSQSQSKSFEFVLVTDNESRRQVRRHAMRQYMHQRRLDSIARLGAARVPAAGWTARPVPDPSCLQAPIEQVDDLQNEAPIKGDKGSPSTDEEPPNKEKGKGSSRWALPKSRKVKREDSSYPLVPKLQYSDPKVTPEHGAVQDPFSSYPVPVTDADHELIQHCKLAHRMCLR